MHMQITDLNPAVFFDFVSWCMLYTYEGNKTHL